MGNRNNKKRPLTAIQAEVTGRCTRSCFICPRFNLAVKWQSRDLNNDIWEVIEPDLHLAGHIHLQGRGEPLLHGMLPIWVAKARDTGCSVGITTNGDLIESAQDWLIEGSVDILTL
jgi:molybdenum cofactor biosynthesis enzyme MoaA